ncbi:MAG: DUF411 domain-containing protein, partial [Candidatus Woesearchaeota archaeon]|nr:DUF411 domain-containing protein [Candidatus Woesearchaeota archaeon]
SITVSATSVTIYKSESCGHCSIYLKEFRAFLAKQGITDIVEKSILSDKEALQELDSFTRKSNIPYSLQGHMVTRINDLTLEGHVPLEALEEIFQQYPNQQFPKLVLFQDSMEPFETEYTVLFPDGATVACTTDKSFAECTEQQNTQSSSWKTSFFFLVVFNAFLAGIHPCTITVLLFFLAFLFTLRRSRLSILKVGAAYIVGIFLAYFSIGIGILRAVTFSSDPHFAAKVGAFLVLLLGIFNLVSYYRKNTWSLGMPKFVKPTLARLLERATIPTIFLVGLLVGICSFGCTAGIYLSIMSLLLVKTQYLQGIFYLFLYNFMFIVPLIVILIMAGNKKVVAKLEHLELTKGKRLKLISGIIMILLSLLIFGIIWM